MGEGGGGGDQGDANMKIVKVSFQSEGYRISGVLHLPEKKNPSCVIASHGLLSSKDSEKYIALGKQISKEGMALLRFDFRGIGESEGTEEDNTISKKIADLSAAIGFMRNYSGLGDRIGLIGEDETIKAVVIWATPLHMDDFKSKERDENTPLPHAVFFEDLPKHRLLPLLTKVSNCFVIHGEEDELVPVEQAWGIFRNLNTPKEMHVIGKGDHRLTDPIHRQRAIDLTVDWFKKYL